MTTLNARANQAFHALVEKHGEDWFGFDNQRDAFEEGWETGYKAKAAELPMREQIAAAAHDESEVHEFLGDECWGSCSEHYLNQADVIRRLFAGVEK